MEIIKKLKVKDLLERLSDVPLETEVVVLHESENKVFLLDDSLHIKDKGQLPGSFVLRMSHGFNVGDKYFSEEKTKTTGIVKDFKKILSCLDDDLLVVVDEPWGTNMYSIIGHYLLKDSKGENRMLVISHGNRIKFEDK